MTEMDRANQPIEVQPVSPVWGQAGGTGDFERKVTSLNSGATELTCAAASITSSNNTDMPELALAMLPSERQLLEAFVACSSHYVEFGSGGSTCLAATLVKYSVDSIDSSQLWLERVKAGCLGAAVVPRLHFVDIGPIGDWGRPTDESARERWPNYSSGVWAEINAAKTDLCLVDGRFRVACFLEALLRCGPSTRVAIHDFQCRPQYHVIRDFAEEIASADNLSVFLRKRSVSDSVLRSAIATWQYDPD
jgi:hypothetical protein